MHNAKVIIVVVLALIVIGLGYAIYTRTASSPADENTPITSATSTTATSSKATAPAKTIETTPIAVTSVPASKITLEAVRKLVTDRGVNPTPEKIKAYSVGVDNASVASKAVDITGCVATPNVVLANAAEPLIFVNKDSVSHTIYYGGAAPLVVEGASQKAALLVFPNADKSGSIVSPFTCDTDKADLPIGILNLIPRKP